MILQLILIHVSAIIRIRLSIKIHTCEYFQIYFITVSVGYEGDDMMTFSGCMAEKNTTRNFATHSDLSVEITDPTRHMKPLSEM